MSRARDRAEHAGHTYEDQVMSQYDDDHERAMQEWAEGDIDESDELPCRYCGKPVYWGPFHDEKGIFDRRLFTASTKRLHDCRVKPDPDGFDVVPG